MFIDTSIKYIWFKNGKPVIETNDLEGKVVVGKYNDQGHRWWEIDPDGDTVSMDVDDEAHSFDDEPGVIDNHFHKRFWYNHGKKHRDDYKPAIITKDGNAEWWIDDVEIPQEVAMKKYEEVYGEPYDPEKNKYDPVTDTYSNQN